MSSKRNKSHSKKYDSDSDEEADGYVEREVSKAMKQVGVFATIHSYCKSIVSLMVSFLFSVYNSFTI